MSQVPSDPPPLPVVPLPVEPMYMPVQAGRPGVIGFIGITSIVVASLCMFAGIGSGLMDVGFVFAASAAKTMSAIPPTTAPLLAGVGNGGERLPSDGLPVDDRRKVADGLTRVRHLSPPQLAQLDELLAEHGKTVVPSASLLTPQQLAASVSGSRHLVYAGTSGSDSFELGDGQLEISDDRAVFFPTHGQPALRSYAIQLPTNAFGSSGLTPDQIRSILRTINELNGANIKNTQRTSLIQSLRSPGQQIVVPTTDGSDPAWEIDNVTTEPDGTLSVSCHHGTTYSAISWNPDGTMASSSVSTAATSSAVMPTVNLKAAVTTLVLTVIQLLLAIFLLVAGIVTVRGSPHGGRLHWIYVLLKLPIAALTAAASAWMWSSLFRSGPSGGTAAPAVATWMSLSMGIMPVALACLYPITLIFLLLSRSARMYYSTSTIPTH